MIIKEELDIDTKAIDPTISHRSRSPDKSQRKMPMREVDPDDLDRT